jgi:hypothetical protein
MARRFSHPEIEVYTFDDLPLGEQMVMVDAKWIDDYDAELTSLDDVYGVAPGTTVIATARTASSLVLTLYFVQLRHHRVKVTLPRSEFVAAAGRRSHDVKPFVFVRGDWFEKLHLKQYSVFALIDAIGVKKMLRDGTMVPERLLSLRDRIDEIARINPEVAFVSFADSLLLKSDWTVGHYERGVRYTYAPERLLGVLPLVRAAFRDELGLDMYAVLTQGSNEYDEASPLHVAPSKNHVSLNTLGLPFAQLISIDHAVRGALRAREHAPTDIYMDTTLFLSLRLRKEFDREGLPRHNYDSLLSTEESYVCIGMDEALSNLRADDVRA